MVQNQRDNAALLPRFTPAYTARPNRWRIWSRVLVHPGVSSHHLACSGTDASVGSSGDAMARIASTSELLCGCRHTSANGPGGLAHPRCRYHRFNSASGPHTRARQRTPMVSASTYDCSTADRTCAATHRTASEILQSHVRPHPHPHRSRTHPGSPERVSRTLDSAMAH